MKLCFLFLINELIESFHLNILLPTLNNKVPVKVPEANQKNLSQSALGFYFKSLLDLELY